MKLTPSSINTWAIDQGYNISELANLAENGAYQTVYNNCKCRHGKSTLRCPQENKDYCDPKGCNKYYHYDAPTQKCKKNLCKCDPYFQEGYEIGTKGPAKECHVHNTQECDCNKNYHHDDITGKCVENVCVCNEPDSAPVANKDCTENGSHQCIKCPQFEHYDHESRGCRENICHCPYGISQEHCMLHNSFNCEYESCYQGEIDYVQVDVSPGTDCVRPCTNSLVLDTSWFSPAGDNTRHWLLVDTGERMNFSEAENYCQAKGSYVGLPSSVDNLEELTLKIPTPTWIGLKKHETDGNLVWERFGEVLTKHTESDFINIDSNLDHNCFQVKRDSNNAIIKEAVNCSSTVDRFMCEYFVTENEKKSKGLLANSELSFHNAGYNYAYYQRQMNWTDALSECESRGPGWSLAEIASKRTLDSLLNLAQKGRVQTDENFWIGAEKKYISKNKGCGINPKEFFRWINANNTIANSDIEHKEQKTQRIKEKTRCCLTISPAGKKQKENMYQSFECSHDKEFLCQQRSSEQPFCLNCGNHHQIELLPNSEKVCEKHRCLCENGIAVNNRDCEKEGETMCVSCNFGFFKNLTGNDCLPSCDAGSYQVGNDCLKKTCTCLNGTPVPEGVDCINHGENLCQSCNNGYHQVGNDCVIKQCTCLNGTPVEDGEDCFTNGDNLCHSCDAGYHIFDQECHINQCQCSNGMPVADGLDCITNNSNICQSCDVGYYHSGDGCLINQCNCLNGTPVEDGEDCTTHGKNICQNCDDGFYQSNDDCLLKVCTCSNGNPVPDGQDCNNHGENLCQSCNPGYYLFGEKCLKRCTCSNGTHIEDGMDCSNLSHDLCLNCDDGYYLLGNNSKCELNPFTSINSYFSVKGGEVIYRVNTTR